MLPELIFSLSLSLVLFPYEVQGYFFQLYWNFDGDCESIDCFW